MRRLPITAVGEREVAGACPLDCPDCCSWLVTVKDGVATRLRGNPEHPVTRGALCVKVNRYLEHAAAPDRVLHPLRRTGGKGEGRFERITWDEAIAEICGRLTDVIAEYGGEAIWPYQGTGNLGYLQGIQGRAGSRLWNVLGASRHDMTICSAAGMAGLHYAMGTSRGMDPEDLPLSRLILLWGTNTISTGHHLWKFVQAARERGAWVVAIDPVRTRTAAQADEHVAPLPGTDAALALGLLNVVVSEEAQDEDYLARRTLGWDDFRARIEQFPPRRVAAITGLPEETVLALGRRLAHTRPTAIRVSQGAQRHAGGGTTLRTLACLPGVTGDWDRPGGGLLFSTDTYFGANLAALFRDDLLRAPVRTLSMTRIGEGLLDLNDPPVKALVVYAANPVASVGHTSRVRAGLAREDLFTVVMEHFLTDTADYADIVLPATMQTEHNDLLDAYGHVYLGWNEQAVEPPGECLSTTETFRRIARGMGLTEPALYDSDHDLAKQLLDSDHPSLRGISLEALREKGWLRLNLPRPLLPHSDGFPTESGRLEFRSARAAADGHDPVAGYVPPAEVGDPERARRYPFALVSGASHYAINSIFGNNPELRRRQGDPVVLVHPDDAREHGISDGEAVRVSNERGEFRCRAGLSDRVRRGVAATTKGHWRKLAGVDTVNATVPERDSDMGGGAVFQDNRVEIRPCPR